MSYKDKEPDIPIEWEKKIGMPKEMIEQLCQTNPTYKKMIDDIIKKERIPAEKVYIKDFTDKETEITDAIRKLKVSGNQ